MGAEFLALRRTMRGLDLVTVCEEAGCPNIFECWADGTATFMINGERCTRACGFCLVDTRHPLAARPRRARARGRGRRAAGPGPRRGHRRGPRRPPRRRRGRLRRHHRRHPPADARPRPSRCSSPTARATPASLGADLRRPARRPQPQPRDGGPPAAGRAPVGRLRPQPGRPGPGQGRRAHGDQVGPHPRAWARRADEVRRARWPTSGPSASTS